MICTICLENLNDDNSNKPVYTLDDCGHSFHTDCIMSWFRSGKKTCPLCLNEGSNYMNILASYSIDDRTRLIRDMGHSKNAPEHIKEELSFYADNCERVKKLEKALVYLERNIASSNKKHQKH